MKILKKFKALISKQEKSIVSNNFTYKCSDKIIIPKEEKKQDGKQKQKIQMFRL